MLEGLFIFCLLIRAARRGGGIEREGGKEGGDTRGKVGRLTEGGESETENTLFREKEQL